MKIEATHNIVIDGNLKPPGTYDVDTEEAHRLVRMGLAKYATAAPKKTAKDD